MKNTFINLCFLKKLIIVIICFVVIALKADATHIMGSELNYKHISGNDYQIILRYFQACDRPVSFSTTELITITSNTGQLINVALTRTGLCNEITPLCPSSTSNCGTGTVQGAEECIFVGGVTLAAGFSYTIRNSTVNRDQDINTILLIDPVSGFDINMHLLTILDLTNVTSNNSPEYTSSYSDIVYVCTNQYTSLNFSAVDVDGDKLKYSLMPCLTDKDQIGTVSVDYLSGYSATHPLATTQLDPNGNPNYVNLSPLGILSFTPTIVGQNAVIRIQVEEYRNNIKIGEINRDVEIKVINCNNNIPYISSIDDDICIAPNIPFCQNITAQDVNGDIITLTASSTILPPATFTSTPAAGTVTGQFCWTPTSGDIGKKRTVVITAKDDNCPLRGTSTEIFQLLVSDDPCCRVYTDILGVKGQTKEYYGTTTFDGIYYVADNIIVYGVFILNPGTIFYVAPRVKIKFYNNATLKMNDATITAACDTMWGGIAPAYEWYNVFITGTNTYSEISHSEVGIFLTYNASKFTINKTRFLNNYENIRLTLVIGTADDYITNCFFGSNPSQMKAPYNIQPKRSKYCIKIDSQTDLSNSVIKNNYFTTCSFGVVSEELSKYVLKDNTFTNNFIACIGNINNSYALIEGNTFNLPETTGQYSISFAIVNNSTSSVEISNNLFIGTNTSSFQRNEYGIFDRSSNGKYEIKDNQFVKLKYAINIGYNSYSSYSIIKSNSFNQNLYAVFADETPDVQKANMVQIRCNEFSKGYSGASVPTSYGIYIAQNGYLNEQGDCGNVLPPAGNKFIPPYNDWYSIWNGTNTNPDQFQMYGFVYNRYSNENIGTYGPTGNVPGSGQPPVPWVNIKNCGIVAVPNTCPGSIGAPIARPVNDILNMVRELISNKIPIEKQIPMIPVITFHFTATNNINRLDSINQIMKNHNLYAYNSMGWFLADHYNNSTDYPKSIQWRNDMVMNSPNDSEILNYKKYMDITDKINHYTTPQNYTITTADMLELEQVASSGTALAKQACVMLMLYNPSHAICWNENSSVPKRNSRKAGEAVDATNPDANEILVRPYLSDNIPNPFNNTSTIVYYVPNNSTYAEISICDLLGRKIKTTFLNKGYGEITIQANELPKGVYIYSMSINNEITGIKKMLIY